MRWRSSNSRVVALALLGLLMFAAFELIVSPLLTAYTEVARRIEQSRASLNRYRVLSAQRPELLARIEETKEALANSTAHLKVLGSNTIPGAALQNHVRSIVEGAGGVLSSSQILPPERFHPEISFRRIGLRLKAHVPIEHLQDLLYELETDDPYIVIKEIIIMRGNAANLGNMEKASTLQVRMEVYGLSD